MTPNVDATPVTIQINRILGKFCQSFQLKS